MDFNLELTYEKKGVLGLCQVNESKYFSVDTGNDITENEANKENAKKAVLDTVKKLLRLFNNDKYFNTWILVNTARDYRNAAALIGIRQSWSDRDCGVYEVYIYGKNTTDTKKVSKDILLKELKIAID